MCGLKKDLIVLSESDLNFTKVVETAQSIEAVDKQARPMKMGTTEQDSELNQVSQRITCFRCGKSDHKANQCRFRNAECHKCGKCGHLKSVCRSLKVFQDRNPGKRFRDASRSSSKLKKTKYVRTFQKKKEADSCDDMALFKITKDTPQPVCVLVKVNKKSLAMEVDRRAVVSLISEEVYRRKFSSYELRESEAKLKTYTAESVNIVGEFSVLVEYENKEYTLPLLVVKGSGPALLVKNWLGQIKLNWHKIFHTYVSINPLDNLVSKYLKVFRGELRTITQYIANLTLKEGAKRRFWKPPLP